MHEAVEKIVLYARVSKIELFFRVSENRALRDATSIVATRRDRSDFAVEYEKLIAERLSDLDVPPQG